MRAEGRAGLGGGTPFPNPVTVLTPATERQKDSPTALLRRIVDKFEGEAQPVRAIFEAALGRKHWTYGHLPNL